MHRNIPVQVPVAGGGQNGFPEDAGIAVCAIPRIPRRKTHFLLRVPALKSSQQVFCALAVYHFSHYDPVTHRASQMRRRCRSVYVLAFLPSGSSM